MVEAINELTTLLGYLVAIYLIARTNKVLPMTLELSNSDVLRLLDQGMLQTFTTVQLVTVTKWQWRQRNF